MSLKFRPHHFLCTLGFEGKGYSDAFVTNYSEIAALLRERPEGDATPIRVTFEADSICTPCPNRRGAGCSSTDKIAQLDAAHAATLQLKHGDELTWAAAKRRIRNHFTLARFEAACAPCEWKKLGVCEAALKRLHAELPDPENNPE